ncbi:MAG: LytTR family DNA-binding domain-containing protein [Arachidicoccus sp.]|nr:LytTR family DNA-binding domain-containing protein [Arachidicoccus sp.]
MNAIAIDDEPLALELIQQYAKKFDNLTIQSVFTDALEAEEYLKTNEIDLIFLDIQMPEVNGIEFFKNLNNKPEVIFTTAYSRYAVEGFTLNAVDYLLKPFDFERFLQAVEKAEELIKFRQNKSVEEGYLLVKYNYQWQKIAYKDIDYIEALDDYIKIVGIKKPLLIHMSMKSADEKLPSEKFVRVHRSYIVSLDKITSWNKNTITIHEKSIPISSTYQKQVQDILNNLMEES